MAVLTVTVLTERFLLYARSAAYRAKERVVSAFVGGMRRIRAVPVDESQPADMTRPSYKTYSVPVIRREMMSFVFCPHRHLTVRPKGSFFLLWSSVLKLAVRAPRCDATRGLRSAQLCVPALLLRYLVRCECLLQ
jgi:hypothetical protein